MPIHIHYHYYIWYVHAVVICSCVQSGIPSQLVMRRTILRTTIILLYYDIDVSTQQTIPFKNVYCISNIKMIMIDAAASVSLFSTSYDCCIYNYHNTWAQH